MISNKIKLQNFQLENEILKNKFMELKGKINSKESLKLSWSNWGFGIENLEDSIKRLKNNNLDYIELHGNKYGPDLGYSSIEVNKLLKNYDMKVSGVCGMFSKENDLSSNNPIHRQRAIDYIKRQVEFTAEVGGEYLLVVPAAVGRPVAYDDCEIERSIDSLSRVADIFVEYKIKGAIEPIRAAETSIIHTVAEAREYIERLNHPGIQHINGDIYHMQSGETHIGKAILSSGKSLVNLHMADSNRCALGEGSMDLDSIIMALYILGYNEGNKYVTPEPLGPGADPYPAMNGKNNPKDLDLLVKSSIDYFRFREKEVLSLLK
ncbi:MAG: sugar phosphate isomerase/epimerase [Cetobacterium sp.]|uniref:sugar phosphate isomerase/epimerase family protein n=1 Tax=Cetobacterium sp. TaxID=2071632 RepID=UPI002FC68B8F